MAAVVLLGIAAPTLVSGSQRTAIIEGTFIAIALLAFVSGRVRDTWLLLAASFYLLVKTVLALQLQPAAPADFLQAYKAYLYLPLIVLVAGRGLFSRDGIARLFRPLLMIFAVVYLVKVGTGVDRPTVFAENNYELVMLIGFFVLAYPALGAKRSIYTAILIGVVFLGASRSALVALVAALALLFFNTRSRFAYFQVLAGAVLCFAVLGVFSDRSGGAGLRATDRFRFFEYFQHEVGGWNAMNWLFGSAPLTNLSDYTCNGLSYYYLLFSSSDPTECYSVVLHSFLMRLVFDQGVLGATFLIAAIWYLTGRGVVTTRERLAIVSIGLLNSLSVSGFNNIFCTIVVAICASMSSHPAPETVRLSSEQPGRGRRGVPQPSAVLPSTGAGQAPADVDKSSSPRSRSIVVAAVREGRGSRDQG